MLQYAKAMGMAALSLALTPVCLFAADTIAPPVPAGLAAVAGSCGQVNLTWNAVSDESGGSGMRAYVISRSDGETVPIGSGRTWFADTIYVKSGVSYGYKIAARDAAGNQSPWSSIVNIATPACPPAAGDIAIDDAALPPLGKHAAVFGARTVVLYQKLNATTLRYDTWTWVRDEDTGVTSRFLLHLAPSYRQTETDYVLTSATDLFALSYDRNVGGQLRVSQYKLNGTGIPTSATLVSATSFGDANSRPKSMIRLKSGAVVIGWHQEGAANADGSVNIGFAYRGTGGAWSTLYPVVLTDTSGGTLTLSEMTLAQHPVDDSIWAFSKRDAFSNIAATHLREQGSGLTLDWVQPAFISWSADGANGVQGELPFVTAVPDPTRGAILLAYQTRQDQILFIDPLLNDGNSIFVKKATLTVARIDAAGGKQFLPPPVAAERGVQFGLGVHSDGAIWLAWQPINPGSYTWNEVYTARYGSAGWETPALLGYNYKDYDVMSAERDPGALIARADRAQFWFRAPDGKLHGYSPVGGTTTQDSQPPSTAVTSPSDGTAVAGTVTVAATAMDNVGVTKVDFLVDGALRATATAAPYQFVWNSAAEPPGNHSVQSRAHDAAGNAGTSAPVTVSVAAVDATAPVTSVTSPATGSTVTRNTTVTIAAAASDNVGVARVEFSVNGALVCTDTAAPYSCAWKVPGKSRVDYTLQARAFDAAGNSAANSVKVTSK